MAGSKRKINDENVPPFNDRNTPITFVDGLLPSPKRIRRVARTISNSELQDLRNQQAAKDARETERHRTTEEVKLQQAEEKRRAESTTRIGHILSTVTEAGYETLYAFFDDLLTTKDRAQSSRVSRMLVSHGNQLLDRIQQRQPDVANEWAIKISGQILADEGHALCEYLRPRQGQHISELLYNFSLDRIMEDAEKIAPSLCMLLRQFGTNNKRTTSERKNQDLVSEFLPSISII